MDRKAAVKTKKKSNRIHRVDTITYQNKFALPLNESFKKLKDENSGQKNGEIVSKDQNDDPKKMKKVEDGLKVITKVSINTAINRSNWPIRKESKDNQFLYSTRHMTGSSAAIPCVSLPLAIFFLVCNVLIPGLGTILGGFSYCCCATTYNEYDRSMLANKIPGLVCTNLLIGISQLFTIPFLLVGWFWSFSWGVTMVYNAMDRRDKKIVKPFVERHL